jgi:hypothetical protein
MDGFVDSASLYEVVNYLRLGRSANRWAVQVSHDLGALFIGAPRIHIMPGFERDGFPSDAYGKMVASLTDTVRIFDIPAEVKVRALGRMRRWARRNPDKVRDMLGKLYDGTYADGREDYGPFVEWLANFFRYNTVEHSSRLGGVFNKTLIPELSLTLQVPKDDLVKAWHMSCDSEFLSRSRFLDRASGEPLRIMWDACATAAMLRGRFHDGIAELSGVQVVHHPVRSPVLKKLTAGSEVVYQATDTQQFLSAILLNAALREKGTDARVAAWSGSVGVTRSLAAQGLLDLSQQPTLDSAERAAVEAARKIGVPAYGSVVSQALELVAVVGVGAATSFTLTPWEGFAFAAAAGAAVRVPQVQRVLEDSRRASRRKNRRLAAAPPGRLARNSPSSI